MKTLTTFITENQIIGFNKANSHYGECIILAGGSGSGKGFITNRINASYKKYDVDELKGMYYRLLKKGKLKDELRDFDFSNPEDVSLLHQKVKQHGWNKKRIDLLFKNKYNPNKEANSSKILPNILFDKVSSEINDITEIATRAKMLGYNVTLIWVLCNIETAKVNNKIRKRYVDEQDVLIPAHKGAYKTITDLFNNKYPDFNDYIDNAWIGYSAGFGRKLEGKYEKSPVIQINKDADGKFIFNQKALVDEFLAKRQPIDYRKLKSNLDKHEKYRETKNFIRIEKLNIKEKEAA